MLFRTQFSEKVRYPSYPGNRIKPIYGLEVDKKGVTQLVVKGKEDLYDFIQSHKDSVDIHKILDRFQNGDLDALNKYQGYYLDITDAPKSLAEALNIVAKGRDLFNSLPVDVREKFNHNPEEFIAAIGTEEFKKALDKSPTLPVDSEKPVENVENGSAI